MKKLFLQQKPKHLGLVGAIAPTRVYLDGNNHIKGKRKKERKKKSKKEKKRERWK